MNIYDEALKRAKEIYDEYYCPVGIIENAIERAKKVEELKELYKLALEKSENSSAEVRLDFDMADYHKTLDEIEVLEKELEELK